MSTYMNAEELRMPVSTHRSSVADSRLPRHRPGEKFLKGPIPWAWLQIAAKLPGSALKVGVLLWQRAWCVHRRRIKFCQGWGREMDMSTSVTRRGLRALEMAKLVTLERPLGSGLMVTINDAPVPAEMLEKKVVD